MKDIYNSNASGPVRVSFILLDWSCRESFHILDYLQKQTVSRECFEVLWIENYSRVAAPIQQHIDMSRQRVGRSIVDRWTLLEAPTECYYHKHLMYNAGIHLARGEIIAICDSDVMVRETFVESIINSFQDGRNIVLHLDEVRNIDKKYYPFNYPSFEQVCGPGVKNWKGATTTGLADRADPLHTRNYGACMAARRSDLIAIGGADEHIDFLGHICGPYDMTFRLVNHGLKEVWHENEFLYHTWHPGTDGHDNYIGPHDGLNMSTTSLKARMDGRILPLLENPAIRLERLNRAKKADPQTRSMLISKANLVAWTKNDVYGSAPYWAVSSLRVAPFHSLQSALLFAKMVFRNFALKLNNCSRKGRNTSDFRRKGLKSIEYLKNMVRYNESLFNRFMLCLKKIRAGGRQNLVLLGDGQSIGLFKHLAKRYANNVSVVDVCTLTQHDDIERLNLRARDPSTSFVLLATAETEDALELLETCGVDRSSCILV